MSRPKPPSGPRGYPLLGVLPMLRRDTLGFLQRTAREFGDLVPLPILMSTALLLNHPSHVEHVLQRNYRNYRKAPMIDRLKPLFGENLVTAQGEFWAKQRQLIQPAFHRRKIDALAPLMVGVTRLHLEGWSQSPQMLDDLNLSDDIAKLTLETVLLTMFTSGLGVERDSVSRALVLANDVITKRVWNLTNLSAFLPTQKNRAFNAAVAMLHGIVERAIADRKFQDALGDDLLGILLAAAAGDTDEWMNEELLRDEVITLMLAGYESTATMLTWALFFLWQHPHYLERMRSEIDEVLRGEVLSAEALGRLDFSRRVIQEVGRLRPSIWWFARTAQ